ncbi:hypothetical protein KAT24_02180 [Candidatus Pacearchaeota archaeon]|nr:hypothetical protein [Candidatus Pacearchaeota archaeon]
MTEKNKKIEEKEEKKIAEPQSDSENKELTNKKNPEPKGEANKQTLKEKIQDKKEEKGNKKEDEKKSKEKQLAEKPKKTEAVINGKSLPTSTKKSSAVCKFIQGKRIQKAISDLEQVLVHKKVVPMKGEIPHKKGKRISSGGYPKKTVEYFIKLLKSLQTNANVNGLDEPVIVEAIANMASRPYGKFGRVRRKRTHVKIKVREHRSVYPQLRNMGAKKK